MRHLHVIALVALSIGLALAPGCSCNGSSGAPACTNGTDVDGDHYGPGCPAGADCDDNNPGLHDDCCAAGIYAGCPCDPAIDVAPISCFEGPAGLSGTAPCQRGLRSCNSAANLWDACVGQVTPQDEVCNDSDDDCDGTTDEGVMSTCGNCLPGCDDTGVDAEPFPCMEQNPAIECDGVSTDPNGDLVLDSSTIENHYLWIANDPEGTVTKIDTRTGREIARYASVTHARVVDHAAGRPFAAWSPTAQLHRPSRTAVDFYGDVWVANRAPGTQPTITKILNDVDDCTDRNGNLTIDTSRDVDNDGRITITNPAEFFGEADECIAMTVAVGTQNTFQARALAIDAGVTVEGQRNPGNVWVGMYTEQAFYQISGVDGSLMQRVPATGTLQAATASSSAIQPYGAAIDSQGRLWSIGGCCGPQSLLRIDTGSNPAPVTRVAATSPGGAYGIAVDLMDRVWVGSYTGPRVDRYDPAAGANGTWTTVNIPNSSGWITRGVGIDTRGNVWAAMHGGANSRIARINATSATSTGVYDLGGNTAIGVGVDFDGDVWAVNQASPGTTSRLHIDPVSGNPAPHATTGNMVDTFPTGPNPYTYSDFTGLGLRTVTRPSGEYVVPIQGCPGSNDLATWTGVNWASTEPPGTEVEIYVRAGNDLGTLNQAQLYGPWLMSPANLTIAPGPVPQSRYLLLIIRMISNDRESTPIVHSYSVAWGCPGGPVGRHYNSETAGLDRPAGQALID